MSTLPERIAAAIDKAASNADLIVTDTQQTWVEVQCAEQVLRAAKIDRRDLANYVSDGSEWTGTGANFGLLNLAARYGITKLCDCDPMDCYCEATP